MRTVAIARWMLVCVALSLPILALAPAGANAQRRVEARTGVYLASPVHSAAADSALFVPQAAGPERKRCGTLCSTFVGALAGAAIGAGATAIEVHSKPSSERSIVDGPAIALGAILGAVVGGVAGLVIGLRS